MKDTLVIMMEQGTIKSYYTFNALYKKKHVEISMKLVRKHIKNILLDLVLLMGKH